MHSENISKLNSVKNRINRDRENEWEVIPTRTRVSTTDTISARINKKPKEPGYLLIMSIGSDITDVCELSIGDRILPFKSRLNSTLIKLCKDSGGDGYKLTKNNQTSKKVYLTISLPNDRQYITSIRRELNFDIQDKAIIIDIASLIA